MVAHSPPPTADHTVSIWEAATGAEIRTLRGHTSLVCDVAYSPDGRTLASASVDGTVKLWEIATGRVLHTLSGHETTVFVCGVQPGRPPDCLRQLG